MSTKEKALKIAEDLDLINIIKYLIGSSEVLITQTFLYGKSVQPQVVFSLYDNTITSFRYGPWVNFIIDFYQTSLKEKEQFNKKAWEHIEL